MEHIEMVDTIPGTDAVPNEDGQDPSLQQQQQVTAETTQDTGDGEEHSASNENSDDDPQVGQNDESQDEIESWAEKQGIDLENPTPEQTKTLAKRLRDTQKSFHEANSRAKQAVDTSQVEDLYKVDEGDDDEFEDPALKIATASEARINGKLAALNFREFITGTPEAADLAGEMIKILDEEKTKYGADAARLLSNNHGRLLTLAKAASLDQASTAAYDNGRKDERQHLAKTQQAAGPASNAISSAPASNKMTDKQIANMTTEEYVAWKAAGNNPWDIPA